MIIVVCPGVAFVVPGGWGFSCIIASALAFNFLLAMRSAIHPVKTARETAVNAIMGPVFVVV